MHPNTAASCPPHAAPDPESRRWLLECPPEVAPLLDEPVRFEHHEDRDIPALKLHGLDAAGRRCYYRHLYAVRDETFDDDDLPTRVETYREQVTAWRLPDGRWLRHLWRISGQPGCGRRIERVLSLVERAGELER
jgi:hypothetical protein